MNNLTHAEELRIKGQLQEPHFSYLESTLVNRTRVANSILRRNSEDMLLLDKSAFLVDSVLAGLTENHIEYIAKKAPKEYKEVLIKVLLDEGALNGAFEVAKSMDENYGSGSNINQKRQMRVIQYISDNQECFRF